MKASSAGALEIVEAIYRPDDSERAWIDGILAAARPALDRGHGIIGLPFEVGASGLIAPWASVVGAPSVTPKIITSMMAAARHDATVQRAFRATACATSSECGFVDHPAWKALIRRGIYDQIALCGFDTTGHGVMIGPLLGRVTTLDPRFRARFARVAAHLGIGQRYRRLEKRAGAPAAVFSPGAKLLHAEGDATLRGARAALARAVAAIDRARGRQRRTDPDGALAAWKGLVAARWSLVDQFESDGKRYVVARENEPRAIPVAALSKREQQVVGYIALGHTSKLIAYELGIADSTVRVLLSRAMQRLNVTTRGELAAKVLAAFAPAANAVREQGLSGLS